MDINSGMDDILIMKGDFGFTLSFTGAPSGWASGIYLVVWPVGDPTTKTSFALTEDGDNWNRIIEKGDFDIAGKFYYELTCKITDTIEESTKRGNLEVADSPVLHT